MDREVKCDRKSNSCFLSPIKPVQFGRGGLVPVGAPYLISLPKNKQSGGVYKSKAISKKKVSIKKVFKPPASQENGDCE